MTSRKLCAFAGGALIFLGGLHAFQRPFREYPGIEYNDFPLPADWQHPAEFIFARLMYPSYRGSFGFGGFSGSRWQDGLTMWTQDYPRADRHFLRALRRLTRIDARSVEQPVNLDDGDDVYNFPFLYGVQLGQWDLTGAQAAKLRDFILRGGFFMGDDFWGTYQWKTFEASMSRVFPDLIPQDLDNASPIFHTVYDLEDRYQVPGARYMETGSPEKCQGCPAQWRAISNKQGRILVALTVNSDIGDSWEFADNPRYEERLSALGIRIGINYILYAITH